MHRPIRTLLFVPGHKKKWIDNVPSFEADAVVLDLEDSVPNHLKVEARHLVAQSIGGLKDCGTKLYVRTNKGKYCYNFADIEEVVQPGLSGIVVPKAEDPEDIEAFSRMVAEVEHAKGMPIGGVSLIPPIETARAAQFVFEIASNPRVETIAAVSARGADLERNLGFVWTLDGIETLYHRSRAVIACKAANKRFAIGGMWQEVHDLDGLRKQALFNKQLGFAGEIVLHPSNVRVINEVYSPAPEQIAHYRGMIEAFAKAEEEGQGAILYGGEHIDIAHVETARDFLALWDRGDRAT
jgi:citrate lyase subunit beta/citryl-CoA lyase